MVFFITVLHETGVYTQAFQESYKVPLGLRRKTGQIFIHMAKIWKITERNNMFCQIFLLSLQHGQVFFF